MTRTTTTAPPTTRFALSTGSVPLEEAFPFAASRGIRSLEFACQEIVNQPQTFDAQRISGVRSLMDAHGVDGVVHTASSVNAAEIVPGVRAAVEDYLHDYVRLTRALGCDTVIVHAGFSFELDLDARLDGLRQVLESCLRVAEPLGVTLALENMNVLPPEAEIRYLGCSVDEVAAILDRIDSPALTSCLDIGHAHLMPGGTAAFIDRFAGRIGHAQLTDNHGVHDEHLAIGEGTLDTADVLARLAAAGYTGQVAVELSDRDAQDRSLAHLRSLLSPSPIG